MTREDMALDTLRQILLIEEVFEKYNRNDWKKDRNAV